MRLKKVNFQRVIMNFCYFLSIYFITIIVLLLILNPIINFYENELVFPFIGKLPFPLYLALLGLFAILSCSVFFYLKLKYKFKFNKILLLGITFLGIIIPLDSHISIYYFAPETHLTAYWQLNDFLLLLVVIGILIFLISVELEKNT
jgi:hypothetical protein